MVRVFLYDLFKCSSDIIFYYRNLFFKVFENNENFMNLFFCVCGGEIM